MWFDVQAALARVDAETTEPPSRVAHVARVARSQAPEFERPPAAQGTDEAMVVRAIRTGKRRPGVIATAAGLGATVTYELLDRLLARGRVAMSRDGEWRLASQICVEREINALTRLWPPK